ncbi:hypothetical protein ACVGXB_01160, partial [Enterobacter intestinihominis]
IILCGCCPAGVAVARATGFFGGVSPPPPATPNPNPTKNPLPVCFKKIFWEHIFGRLLFYFI